MIGRRVTVHPWHARYAGVVGTVTNWEPWSRDLSDSRVVFDDGRTCWFGSGDLLPADDLDPLPSRKEVMKRAEEEQRASLRKMLGDHVQKHLAGERWPGLDFARASVGNMILGAMTSAGLDAKEELARAIDAGRCAT